MVAQDPGPPGAHLTLPARPIEVAIVGLGSWGLCVMERTVDRARRTGKPVRLHVIEPAQLGGGVYSAEQPDYLILNNACGQLSLYAAPDGDDPPPYAVGLHQWAMVSGYRWVGHECRIGAGGDPVRPTDYLPRRLMGEYLVWFYDSLVDYAPPNLEIVRHYAAAVDISPALGGREAVLLDNDLTLTVDHVVLTSGHTFNDEPVADGVHYRRAYPIESLEQSVPPGSSVAVAGMGLVGFDVLTALTIGRGGTFERRGDDRLRYVPSGREPAIVLYSRSGAPYCAKSASGIDPYGQYQPVVCTADEFAALTHPGESGARRHVDFRSELLPLLFAEMQARYYLQAALLADGEAEAAEVRLALRQGWLDGHYEKVIDALEPHYGRFDPAAHLFAGSDRTFTSSIDYQAQTYEMIETDLAEALHPGGSPVKAAQEVLRILRDQLRSVIEFGGLSVDSYIEFQAGVRGRINRLEAGVPPMRSQQLLALLDAGVVRIPVGPNPDVDANRDGIRLRSTAFDEPAEVAVDAVIRGYLDMPSLARSGSPLLKRLYAKGRLTQFSYGDTPVGSVAINEQFHPYDSEGRLQANLSVLGVLTEGVRYFTHYLPSPRSRLRAVYDAQDCIEAVIG
ncbi:FAD/NAD(P)-binding protein [Mycobacterium paraterrae]|uniref:FAD/NAD(P)-binding protein n=1 Tax=Mycobacterium paraterrae TaxID=577492 RepID=A0ABY3VQZ0_9MYCO|nr:FAD/NAD(P)-binding protein [Mycobacterium paraterrae]UMB69919.1 FAD/NAD(P)-binding protein [Mycobacterium paraterrae]